MRASHIWFWFYFGLVEKVTLDFVKAITERRNAKPKQSRNYFDTQLTVAVCHLKDFYPHDTVCFIDYLKVSLIPSVSLVLSLAF